ncbi:MAG: ABC transporter ATP-binding protein [Paracoccaceae bacterium]
MLLINDLSKTFGGITALKNLKLEVNRGEVVGLIGPNGSGKTTTINLVTGIYASDTGSVILDGKPITNQAADKITKAGMARTFQNLRIFERLTVKENVKVAQNIFNSSIFDNLIVSQKKKEQELTNENEELLKKFKLIQVKNTKAGSLSYGEKKRLEMARALAMRPKILLLDEPAAGMSPPELDWLTVTINDLRSSGLAILLVEHHMRLVMGVCDRISVLNFGNKIAEGTPSSISKDPEVITAYLGRENSSA